MACSWLAPILTPTTRREIVDKAASFLKDIAFDAIAVRGMSGALLGSILADKLGKALIVVRKPTENGHSCYNVESIATKGRYIIVDDFIDSGDTADIIRTTISKKPGNRWQYVGIYLYFNDDIYRFWRSIEKHENYNILNVKLDAEEYVKTGHMIKHRGRYYKTDFTGGRLLPGIKL